MVRYYEAEFGLWVEEPDPLTRPACAALWPGEWDHANGPRPRCYLRGGHAGEHRETRKLSDTPGFLEYFWDEVAGSQRVEKRRIEDPDGAGPAG